MRIICKEPGHFRFKNLLNDNYSVVDTNIGSQFELSVYKDGYSIRRETDYKSFVIDKSTLLKYFNPAKVNRLQIKRFVLVEDANKFLSMLSTDKIKSVSANNEGIYITYECLLEITMEELLS